MHGGHTCCFNAFFADTPPRIGKDLMLVELYVMTRQAVARLRDFQLVLKQLGPEVGQTSHDRRLAEMKPRVWHHTIVPTCVGEANTGMAQAWTAVLWDLRVDATCWQTVQDVATCIHTTATDVGVESGRAAVLACVAT